MPKRFYKVKTTDAFHVDDTLNTLRKTIDDLKLVSAFENNTCIHMNEYIIVKTDLKNPAVVTIKSPDQPKDMLSEVPNEFKPELEILIQKYKLKGREILNLKKELKKTLIEYQEFEKQIEILRKNAKEISDNRDNKKALRHFTTYSNKFINSLKEIRSLSSEHKVDVKENLEVVTDTIADTYPYLD